MDVHIGRFYPFGVFQNVEIWRTYFRAIVLVAASLWLVFGFDAVIEQIFPLINNIIPLLTGKISLEAVSTMMQDVYGKGNHLSAVVIYGLSWLFLSNALERGGMVRSFNFFMSMMLTLLNMGIFEVSWNLCCGYFQNLPWLLGYRVNFYQYISWVVIGILSILYLLYYGFKPNLSNRTIIYCVLAIGLWLFWIYYPLPIHQITVVLPNGLWVSSKMFPQTLYPVGDSITGGLHYVENNQIHLVNVLAKIFTTAGIASFCMFRKDTK